MRTKVFYDESTGQVTSYTNDLLVVGGIEVDELPDFPFNYLVIAGRLTLDISAVLVRKGNEVKASASSQIDGLAWRLERARERDTIGAAGETVSEVMAIRESIRRASSRAESEVMLLTTADEIAAFTWAVTPADIPVSTLITVYAFLHRFTTEEAIAIDLAGYGETSVAASVRRYMSLITNAKSIDLGLAETRDGVNGLESAGLLGAGRAATILETPTSSVEQPV